MRYTHSTLTAFSSAIAAIHSPGKGRDGTLRFSAGFSLYEQEAAEDVRYLDALLDKHRLVIARQPQAASEKRAIEFPEDNFFLLRRVGLTPRECEVLHWVSRGKQDAEIAIILGCAARTVGKHIEHLLAKLGAETRLAAVNAAQQCLRYEA